MEKEEYIVLFFVENQIVQIPLEQITQNLRNGFISRQLINVRQELEFPVKRKNEVYLLEKGVHSFWLNDKKVTDTMVIKNGDLLSVTSLENSYQCLFIFKSWFSMNMKRVKLPVHGEIIIGRSLDAHIILDINKSVSNQHAVIRMDKGRGVLEDISGKAGVYLNGKRTIASKLVCGDTIVIMGYTIIYMGEYLLVPERVKTKGMAEITYFNKVGLCPEKVIEETFERTPRIYKSLIMEPVAVDAPPQLQERKQQPFILAAGPSLTMALAMMTQLGIAVSKIRETGNYSSVISSGVMAVSLLAGAVLWPFFSRRYYKKQDLNMQEYRKEKYLAYLHEKEETIKKYQDYNRWIWNVEYYPSMEEIEEYILKKSRRLWGKTPEDDDFLYVRLGIGDRQSEIPVKIPEKHFTLYEDELLEQAFQLGESCKKLENVPIALSLKERKVIGIVGDREKINKMVWCMAMNLSALHSPNEVKIVFVGDKGQLTDFEWMLQLPHIWSDDRKTRFFATNPEEVQNLFLFFNEETKRQKTTYYILFVLNEKLMENSPLSSSLHRSEQYQNITCIYVAEFFSRIPKETEAIILNDNEQSGIYRKNEDNNQFIRFIPDELNYLQIQQMVHSLAALKLDYTERQIGIPDRILFLDMYKVGNVRMLNIQRRWKESRVSRSLAAPIGIKSDGEVFSLDIHEKYHGCHGLVAGMTGSGKSEFLQEYILSLMLNYSPENVAFILIDFKGGDMARPFLKSPHLAATISNLSGNMLYRARVSLEAEIEKRQELFNVITQKLGIDKIDINSWNKYVEEGKIQQKLPHLIIIIDEFAQLKTQQPDFLEYLINVAQVGRSLGIHLILATQKPNGVVSPQIWSNSRFRVCLKVLDQEDSKEMIRRGDAAAIKLPGRAYVQVGYDEIFEQIQTGYSGADYLASERYLEAGEKSVELLDYTASIIRGEQERIFGRKSGKSQLEETVAEIITAARAKSLSVEPLWKPLLKEKIFLDTCIGYDCTFESSRWDQDSEGMAVCGICDLIQVQEQKPFAIHFVRDGHVAVYGMSGTGKTVFLQTLAFSMALKYSPQMLQIFAIDFGGRTLGNMREMPQCLRVAFEDEEEKVQEIIVKIMNQMEHRKKLFAEKECNTYASYLKVTGQKLPMILLMIDNYNGFRERMYALEESVIQLAANAKTYGIYLVLTGNSRNAIYYKIAEHIGTRIVFQMNDKQHYRDILNTRSVLEPEDVKGRALVKYEGMTAEMQTALPFDTVNEAQMYTKIKTVYRKMQLIMPKVQEKEDYEQQNVLQESLANNKNTLTKFPIRTTKETPVFPAVLDNAETLIMGNALYDGRLQGFEKKDIHRVFIGADEKVSARNILLRIKKLNNVELYQFSLSEEPENGWKLIRTESEIGEFVNLCTTSKEQQEKILFIDDFSDFYDTIADEDLVEFGKYLGADDSGNLIVITKGIFDRLQEYRDTGLYVHLVRCSAGIVLGGKIDISKTAMLCKEISTSNPMQRIAELEQGEAVMYHKSMLSYIRMEAEKE